VAVASLLSHLAALGCFHYFWKPPCSVPYCSLRRSCSSIDMAYLGVASHCSCCLDSETVLVHVYVGVVAAFIAFLLLPFKHRPLYHFQDLFIQHQKDIVTVPHKNLFAVDLVAVYVTVAVIVVYTLSIAAFIDCFFLISPCYSSQCLDTSLGIPRIPPSTLPSMLFCRGSCRCCGTGCCRSHLIIVNSFFTCRN
jgi:hypothetical protein